MAINYEWTCKFCGIGNAAGTDRCAVCRNAAIARPIDVDPQYAKERAEDQQRRQMLEALPKPLQVIVGALWVVAMVGCFVAKFAWTIGATFAGLLIAAVAGIPALIITNLYDPQANQRK